MHGGNDEANLCMMLTNIFLGGSYPDTPDINIINGTSGYLSLAGGCVSEHPEPSLGMQSPTKEQGFWDVLDLLLNLAGLGAWQHRESRVSLLSPQHNCSGMSKPGFNK